MPFTTPPPLPEWLARQLPVRRGAYLLESGEDAGRRLHFLDSSPEEGDPAGRPVLLLHGNPAWSFLWRRVIAALPDYRCVAPDLLGLGLSSRLPRLADHTIGRHAAALVERLDLRDAVLVGHDWGGLLGAVRGEAWARAFAGPVALVWGGRDPVLARALPRHERAFPQAPVTRTEAGHFLQEEVPDALAAAVEDVARRAAG